jgi:putative sterol carrier protein
MAEVTSVKQFFEEILPKFVTDPDKVGGMDCTYQFSISGDDGGEWYLTLKDDRGTVSAGGFAEPDCTVMSEDEDWLKIVTGELNPQMAFMAGKIRVQGQIALAMKLQNFLRA